MNCHCLLIALVNYCHFLTFRSPASRLNSSLLPQHPSILFPILVTPCALPPCVSRHWSFYLLTSGSRVLNSCAWIAVPLVYSRGFSSLHRSLVTFHFSPSPPTLSKPLPSVMYVECCPHLCLSFLLTHPSTAF